MIKFKYYIPKYYWDLILFIDVDVEDINNIIQHLHFLYVDNIIVNKVINNIISGYNNAVTVSNKTINKSIITINKTYNDKELVNSIVHEVYHMTFHIVNKNNIEYDSEKAAYLIGNIVADIYDRVKTISNVKILVKNVKKFGYDKNALYICNSK